MQLEFSSSRSSASQGKFRGEARNTSVGMEAVRNDPEWRISSRRRGKPGIRPLEAGAEADQAVDGDADDEVDSCAPIGAGALVTERAG
jgi:hypothetical protein